MIRWGTYKTAKGTRHRWRCRACQATTGARVDTTARSLAALLDYVGGKRVLADYPGAGRTLQRVLEPAWDYWPLAPVCDEVHHVVHVDGIYLARGCVLLVAMSSSHVIGWHLARAETVAAWAALIARIAPPDVVVTDGAPGFAKARRTHWPNTAVQRCTFHVQQGVRACTTTRPRTQAGVQLYDLSRRLGGITTRKAQATWIGDYTTWCATWKTLLAQKTTLETGRVVDTHARLVKARGLLNARLRAGDLFTYLDPGLNELGPVPATNNRIEGFNSRIRAALRTHRGWSLEHRIKAAMWICYQHLPYPQPPAVLAATMPTDTQITALYQAAHQAHQEAAQARARQWGQAIAWHELTWSRENVNSINQ